MNNNENKMYTCIHSTHMCVYTQKSQRGKVTDGEREFGLIAVFTATHLFRIHPRLLPLLDIFRCVCVA